MLIVRFGVPIHPDILPLVEKRYIEATELLGSDRLFNDPRSQTGFRMTYDKYRRKFEFVMADLALNGFSPHCISRSHLLKRKRLLAICPDIYRRGRTHIKEEIFL